MPEKYFFLDFDGVVCDSVPECFLSSYEAYHVKMKGRTVKSVTLREKDLFYSYRPFIRNGEDYMLLHELIDKGVSVPAQDVFDSELRKKTAEQMEEFKTLFYGSREEVLSADKDFWLGLNRLFPGVKEVLEEAHADPNFFVLSTKKPAFIREILLHHGIDWDSEKIFYPGGRTKKEIIESVVPMSREASIVFVDDQLDHLLTAREDSRISPYLASWGYVKEEWVKQKTVPVLDLAGLGKVVSDFLRSRREACPPPAGSGTPSRR